MKKTIFNNDKEIRNNCEIYINNKKIDFTFNYKFSKKGINKINIKCKKDLTNMSYMFNECSSLTSLNLSNFNTNNVNNMNNMFYNCSSFTYLNLSKCKIYFFIIYIYFTIISNVFFIIITTP